MQALNSFAQLFFDAIAILLALAFVVGLLLVAVMYVRDMRQRQHAIRRNFPVIGRMRYGIEHLGPFLRQYLYDTDRDRLPFSRADRSWVYRAAKNLDNTVPFGSTLDLSEPGTAIFANAPFPVLECDALPPHALVIGPHCAQPYTPQSLFNVSGMSYGAISKPAIQALSIGAARAGCWMNTGEGGLSPYHLEGGCDIVMQIGTAKYGVRNADGTLSEQKLRELAALPQVKMFELKLSQGAKPGKGGILPGAKVSAEVAAIRGIPVGEDSISPNGHPEIRTTDDLLDMLGRIRDITGKPVGCKLVLGDPGWVDELCERIRERGIESAPDFITLDGGDGGTGAAPETLIDSVGLPLRESLPMLVDRLTEQGLRERIRIIAAGKLISPAQVAWALCMGADFINSARGFMFALGCIQAMQCNKNSCPTGITTHNPRLQRGLDVEDKASRVYHYVKNLLKEVEIVAHSCGVREPRQLQRRHVRVVVDGGRTRRLDELFPPVLVPAPVPVQIVTEEPVRVVEVESVVAQAER